MRRTPRTATIAVLGLALSITLGSVPIPVVAAPSSVAEARAASTKRAAAALGVPRRGLRLAAFERVASEGGDGTWYVAKVERSGRRPGVPFIAYVEPSSGRVIPVERWRRSHPIRVAPKLDADVASALSGGRQRTVAVWVRSTPEHVVARRVHREHGRLVSRRGAVVARSATGVATARDLLRSAHARSARTALAPVVARARALGLDVEYASRLAPVLWVTGPPALIRRLSERADVLRVQSSGRTSLALGEAGESDQVSRGGGFSHRHGYRGDGVRIAVVEYGNVAWGVPDLDSVPASRREAYTTVPGRFIREDHPTAVMSIIASDSRRRPGIAPRATYISSGTGGEQGGAPSQAEDFRAIEAIENAILPGKGNADVVNASFGQESALGSAAMRAYVDHIVRVHDVHVAAAAGNTTTQAGCQGGARPVVAPGTAWNVVTVGGVDDRGTPRWGDDRLYADSCHGDPPGGTFKPEISAPGVRIGVNGANHTGTSFATPQVAGAMALLIDQVGELRTKPHLVKAILLAGSYLRRTVARRIHHKEGVGTLAMKWSHWAAVSKRRGGAEVAGAGELVFEPEPEPEPGPCFPLPEYQTVEVDTHAGRRVRFVVSWESHGFYDQQDEFGPNDDFMNGRRSDIDIIVRTASGERKASSVSANRTVEVAQWRTRRRELPYTVRIRPVDWQCELPSETVAWAWVAPR